MYSIHKIGRLRAFSIHLCLSLCIGATVGAVFWYVVYPPPLFRAVGGEEIFFVVLMIDVVLGPIMTLMLFKPGKPGLLLDLCVIAAVQLAAMAYGVSTLYAGRPVYIAALGHRFDAVQASEISAIDLEESGSRLPVWGPKWVGIREPDDPQKRSAMIFSALSGIDYGQKPQYHAPIEGMRPTMLREAKPIAELRVHNIAADEAITVWLRAHGHSDNDARYLGLKARSEDMAVILDAKTAEVIGIAPFKPWD